tara:strand:- start:112 stop:975 length:864 start_codon:yes stop_codon:yes gene_type:complete
MIDVLTALGTFLTGVGAAKRAFDPEGGGGGGGGVSAQTQTGGGGLQYTPVGLETLDITPFEYELLEEIFRKEQEEPQQMYHGGELYKNVGGGIGDLFEDIDPVLDDPIEPTFGDSDPDKSSQDKFFEQDKKINKERRRDFFIDTVDEISMYLDTLAKFKGLLDPETTSSIRGRGVIVPGASRSGRSMSNRDLRVGGTTINPFTYKMLKDGGEPDAVLDRRMFAANPMLDGGDVKGPGGPKDDLIPVMASNGEFMLSKAAVDQVGGGDHAKGIARLEAFNELGNQRYG